MRRSWACPCSRAKVRAGRQAGTIGLRRLLSRRFRSPECLRRRNHTEPPQVHRSPSVPPPSNVLQRVTFDQLQDCPLAPGQSDRSDVRRSSTKAGTEIRRNQRTDAGPAAQNLTNRRISSDAEQSRQDSRSTCPGVFVRCSRVYCDERNEGVGRRFLIAPAVRKRVFRRDMTAVVGKCPYSPAVAESGL